MQRKSHVNRRYDDLFESGQIPGNRAIDTKNGCGCLGPVRMPRIFLRIVFFVIFVIYTRLFAAH